MAKAACDADDEAFASLQATRFRCTIHSMSLRSRFFAATYDRISAKSEKAGLASHRQLLLAGASGRVLEIGAGTGANLQYYGRGVESLTLTEPEEPMLKRLQRRARDEAPNATVLRAPAEDLPFEDACVRHGRLDPRPLRRGRPAAGTQGAPPRAPPRRSAALHRARSLRRRRRGAIPGPDERAATTSSSAATATGRPSTRSARPASRSPTCSTRSCRRRRGSRGP